jgi:enoyl-CoA hydratase/carnithine racemase
MSHDAYKSLHIRVKHAVASVTIDHPPMNLLDATLFDELRRLANQIERDDEVKVVVFDSADPDYFIAHYDVAELLARPLTTTRAGTLKPFHQLLEQYRTLPKVTIAQIEGRARGAGSEFALALDLRFGSLEHAVFGQFEAALGLIPGGGGTQRLERLLGRARALEVVLSGQDVDAELAEQYGWINRALPSEAIGPFVDRLARRIASYPAHSLRMAKRAVDAAQLPPHEGLLEEAHLFSQALATPETRRRAQAFLEAAGQTREGERDMDSLIDQL